MGLFDKKYCDVCGEKIGLLGNKKLEDANLCKNCASKLSPWFHERRHSTLDEIKAQLAYRDHNLDEVKAFHTTRTLGTDMKVLIDEGAKKFMVTRARDLEEANPDVLDFSQVTGCDLDIRESKTELYREDKEGKRASYDPPRYEYSYDFTETIHVNNPYFDELSFRLNNRSVETGENSINDDPAAKSANPLGAFLNSLAGAAAPKVPGKVWNAEYQKYLDMGNEIRAILMNEPIQAPAQETAPASEAQTFAAKAVQAIANAGAAASQAAADAASQAGAQIPKVQVKCPYCMAVMNPTADGRCEFCGSPLA